MFTVLLLLTSCKKNSTDETSISENELQGLWSSESYWNSFWNDNQREDVYNFINSNTAIEYVNVVDKKYPPGNEEHAPTIDTPVPGHSGWYRSGDKDRTWTYVYEDNKVILSNGMIFTYMDGKLYKEGSSVVLLPW